MFFLNQSIGRGFEGLNTSFHNRGQWRFAALVPTDTGQGENMGANTVQILAERLWKLWVFGIWPLVLDGKRSVQDLLDFFQMVKSRPADFDLHIGVLRGTHEINPLEHTIDFSVPCMLPSDDLGLERMSPPKSGVVKLKRQGDMLYLDGKPLSLLTIDADGGHHRKVVDESGGNVGAKVLDYLIKRSELWPESWKKDTNGNAIRVFFLGDTFHRSHIANFLYVRYGYWHQEANLVCSMGQWINPSWDSSVAADFRAV
ncbi:hypothetical protein IPJ70_02425 [Candidatus Campbellbacteria bacterium]|nr:MAG: hypothetical protein IPJ70_02425 [Candidatus Campbellbacteria bacterium]